MVPRVLREEYAGIFILVDVRVGKPGFMTGGARRKTGWKQSIVFFIVKRCFMRCKVTLSLLQTDVARTIALS